MKQVFLKRLSVFIGLFFLLSQAAPLPVFSKTLMLEGRLDGRVDVTQQLSFSVAGPVSKLTFRFALPAQFSNKAVKQELVGLDADYYPLPASVSDARDEFGNRFRTVTWNNLDSDARVTVVSKVHVKSELSSMESTAPYPLPSLTGEERLYLKATGMVQSGSPEIVSLSGKLTASARNEYEAVSAVLNYVSDNVKYTYNPPDFDALYTLRTESGNCQNFAHLSMALLRAAGIPARIVGGISLKQPWKVPVGRDNFLVQSMGQGGHAWMEVYFPDLGWLSYDPQESKQFTSTRHIKQTHGLDSGDINDSWKGSPYLPQYSESINAKFLDDKVSLNLKSSDKSPRTYILSNNIFVKAAPAVKPPPPSAIVTPPAGKPEPPLPPAIETIPVEKPEWPKGKIKEFGNKDFPNLVDVYRVVGDKGIRILDKETAEYVTSQYVYAQAFEVERPVEALGISLAMHKFGGDGSIFIDLVADDNGKPGVLTGIRSMPIPLDRMRKSPGYYWVDFVFPGGAPTKIGKGRYWIVLRHSGEAIVNWFYIPGNPYGDGDDTRSTLKGYRWEDIQNYDFVFKVKAGAL